MGMQFKVGDKVAQKVNVIRGEIVDMVIVDKTPQYIVEWTDEQGDLHQRPFTEEQVEADSKPVASEPLPADEAPAV